MYNLFLTLGGILGGRPNYGGPNGQGPNGQGPNGGGPNGGGKELDTFQKIFVQFTKNIAATVVNHVREGGDDQWKWLYL